MMNFYIQFAGFRDLFGKLDRIRRYSFHLVPTTQKRPQPINNPSTAPSCQDKLTKLQESRKAHLGDMSDVLEKRDNLGKEIWGLKRSCRFVVELSIV